MRIAQRDIYKLRVTKAKCPQHSAIGIRGFCCSIAAGDISLLAGVCVCVCFNMDLEGDKSAHDKAGYARKSVTKSVRKELKPAGK